jgi:hypothetical protein
VKAAPLLVQGSAAGDLQMVRRCRALSERLKRKPWLLCCESLGLEGADYRRGYLQNCLRRGRSVEAETIPEKSAQRIFRAADQIIRAGRLEPAAIVARGIVTGPC